MHNPGTQIAVNTRHTMKNAQYRNTDNSEHKTYNEDKQNNNNNIKMSNTNPTK
jgi:hypothetical protein